MYRMQEPKSVFLIFSNGKIVCTGAKSREIVEEALLKLHRKIRELNLVKEIIPPEHEDIIYL